MELFKILGIVLIAAILAMILKGQKSEYALVVALAAGAMVTTILLQSLAAPIGELQKAIAEYGLQSEPFGVALKALGIGYITGFIADTCRDSGQAALAAKAEWIGKCAVFLLALPLILSILKIAVGLIQ